MATGVLGVLLGAVLSLVPSQPAVAATGINKTINFQGKLVNSNGTNIPNGTYNMELKLYTGGTGCVTSGSSPCGGTLQWTEDRVYGSGSPDNRVTVTDGIFQVEMGSVTSLPAIFNNDDIWLSIELGDTSTAATFGAANGDTPMLPFIRFTASPYALNSDLLDGLDSSAFAQLNPASAQSGSLHVDTNIVADTKLQAPLVDSAAGLSVGTSTATSVTVGRATSTTNLTLQGSASTSWSATGASGSTTVSFVSPTAANTIRFQNAGGDVCTTVSTTCSATYQVAGNYLAKNATDTSSAVVSAASYLYGFANGNTTPSTGGVLSLDNGANTGNTLYVTANGNPGANQALIVANNTAGSPSGNLLDLQKGGVSELSVAATGNVLLGADADKTISVASAASSTAGRALTLAAGAGGSGTGSTGGALNLNGGAGGGTNGSGGNVVLSPGAVTGTGTPGSVVVKPQSGNDSTGLFLVQNASGTSVLSADTVNMQINSGNLNVGSASGVNSGSRVFSDSFGSGNLNLWNQGISGTAAIDTTTVHSGKYALKMTASGGAAWAQTAVSTSTSVDARIYANVTSHNTANELVLMRFSLASDPTKYIQVYRASTSSGGGGSAGNIAVYNNVDGTNGISSTALTTGVWHKIELKFTRASSGATATLYLDGTSVQSLTGLNTGTANFDRFYVGNVNSATSVWSVDDVAIDTDLTGDSGSLSVNDSLHVGGTATIGSTVSVGTANSGTLFQNNGATQNVVCAYTGVSGSLALTSAGKTVNDCTTFNITDTGSTTISSIAAPVAGAGSMIYINNLAASTAALTVLGQSVPAGNNIMFTYDGANWVTGYSAAGASVKLQDAYNNSAGAQPSILTTAANKAVTVQSAISSGMAAGEEVFGVRASHSGDTLGNSILAVTSYGLGINVGGTATNPAVTSGIDLQFGAGADRVMAVIDQTTTNAAGNKLTVRAGGGNGSGTGGDLLLIAGAAGATSGATGGAATVQGGAGTGTGSGGTTYIKGGVAGSGGAGGLVVISAAAGGASAANHVGPGGDITIQGGSAAGGDNNGGSVNLSAGNYHGTAVAGLPTDPTKTVPGTVNIGSPVFTSTTESFTQTANNQSFNATQADVDTYGTIVMTIGGAFTGATVTVPSPTNQVAGHMIFISAGSGSVSFTLSATGMSSVNMAAGSTATLIWNGSNWSGTTTASSLQQVYNNTSTAPASIITTSTTKNILFQAGSGFDNANVFQVGNSYAAPIINIDTRNTATGANVATNGGVETGTGCPGTATGWSAFTGTGSATICQNTTASNLAAGVGSLDVSITGTGTGGVNNNLSSTALTAGATYNVSFNIKSSSGTPTIAVEYLKAGSSVTQVCSVPTNGSVNSTSFFKYTCTFTADASGITSSNLLRISKTDASTIAHIYIDNLFVGLQNSTGTVNTGSLQVGGPLSQGLTLFTLDTFAGDPFTGTINQNLYGSMYYSTTLGRIQCYESTGWGSCGAAPDSNLILSPEYAGAVLSPITYNGETVNAHIGTMTAAICSNSKSIQPSYGSICASGEEYNYYQWTTSQVTSQSYSIFVKYQLPPTFGGFASASTVQMVGRVSSTTDASLYYTMYRGSTECGGTGSRTSVGSPANTWNTVSLTSDETACGFQPNDIVTFEIDMYSKNNAYVYASQITFTMLGK